MERGAALEYASYGLRGPLLFEEHGDEIRFEDGVWLIPSCSDGTSVYKVTLGLHPSCECKDFEYRGHRGPCKHIFCARLAEAASVDEDLRIDYPLEEEQLAAVEFALRYFEAWEKHSDHEHDFGGEYAVMKRWIYRTPLYPDSETAERALAQGEE